MSKVGGALPSWYWPPGVPRRVPVPQQPLDRLLRQRFAKSPERPALVSADRRLTYGELLTRVQEIAGGLQALKLPGAIAVSETDAEDSIILFLASLFAGRPVFFADASAPTDLTASQLEQAKVSATLTSGKIGKTLEGIGGRIIHTNELNGNFSEAGGARRANDPAALFPCGRGVAMHSHFSLSAMSAALAAFIIRLRELPFLCTGTVTVSWETLAPALLAMLNGMPVVFATAEAMDAGATPIEAENAYVFIRREEADAMLDRGRISPAIKAASYVFVSTGQFTTKWRRRFEALCGRPIFPLWGLPELGPVIAPHPTWLPVHGHGFPLVNVSLVPIDPGTGKVSIVPWELLEQAEVGVETLSAMLGYTETARNASARAGNALRTHEIASMDHVGVVVLHGRAAGFEEAASAY